MEKWNCRIAPSLGGGFAGTPEEVWGTEMWGKDTADIFGNTVFFGMYGFPDFYSLWKHKGKRAILWAGSDIKHFINGYWLDGKGLIRLEPEPLARWINENCDNYVENGVEHEALMVMGIESKIIPSFLGNIDDYPISYIQNNRPQVYVSVSGNNFEMYGWDVIERIADKCNVDFYLYGNTEEFITKHSNVFVRGRLPIYQMDSEIKDMQCGLRLNDFDGFSEVIAKSILWGQYPISRIGYPYVDSFKTDEDLIKLLNNLHTKHGVNTKTRDYYIKNINEFPWNENNKTT